MCAASSWAPVTGAKKLSSVLFSVQQMYCLGWGQTGISVFCPEGQHHCIMPKPACTGWSSVTGLSLPILSVSLSSDGPPQPTLSSVLLGACGARSQLAAYPESLWWSFRWVVLLSLTPTLSHTLSLCIQRHRHIYTCKTICFISLDLLIQWRFTLTAAMVTAWLHWRGIRLLYGLLSCAGFWKAAALQGANLFCAEGGKMIKSPALAYLGSNLSNLQP